MHITFDTVRFLYWGLLNGRQILFFIGQFLGFMEDWYLKHICILKFIIRAFMNTESVTSIFPSPPVSSFCCCCCRKRHLDLIIHSLHILQFVTVVDL